MALSDVALSCAKQLGRVDSAGTTITDLEAEIKEQIAETIRFYNRKPWHLTEWRGLEITTASGTTWYSTADMTSGAGDQDSTSRTAIDLNTILDIRYMRENTTAGLEQPMIRLPYEEFESLYEGSTPNSFPTYYTYYAGQIGFFPVPDAAYTIYFSAHVKPVIPTADSDTSVWFDEANEMIEAGALARVCLKYLRDRERAQEYGVIEDNAAKALHVEHVRKSSSGKIRPHD